MGLLFIIGVIFLIWVLLGSGHHHHGHGYGCHHHHHHEPYGETRSDMTPRQILDDRYARGEIDRQEYLDRRKDIEA